MIRSCLGIAEFFGRLGCGACGLVFLLRAAWWGPTLHFSLLWWFELAVAVGLTYIAVSPSCPGVDRLGDFAILLALAPATSNAVGSIGRVAIGQPASAEPALAIVAPVSAVIAASARIARRRQPRGAP